MITGTLAITGTYPYESHTEKISYRFSRSGDQQNGQRAIRITGTSSYVGMSS